MEGSAGCVAREKGRGGAIFVAVLQPSIDLTQRLKQLSKSAALHLPNGLPTSSRTCEILRVLIKASRDVYMSRGTGRVIQSGRVPDGVGGSLAYYPC